MSKVIGYILLTLLFVGLSVGFVLEGYYSGQTLVEAMTKLIIVYAVNGTMFVAFWLIIGGKNE